MAFKKFRNMKVCEQSGYKYKATPTIILKGQWLKDAGFDIGDSIIVTCEDGKLIITPREKGSFIDAFEKEQLVFLWMWKSMDRMRI